MNREELREEFTTKTDPDWAALGEHIEECVAYRSDDPDAECEAVYGQWMQPPGVWVGEAEMYLPADAPWCQVRLLAWELSEQDEIA